MPARNYRKMQNRLEIERKRLIEELSAISADTLVDERREGSPFGKREEEANETSELEKRLILEQQVKEQIAEIDNALDKIEKGTYSLCEVCHQAINEERLDALPTARLCLSCKSKQGKYAKTR